MLAREFSLSTSIFVLLILIQESLINLLRLPGGGFSLPLLFAFTWAALSAPTAGALTGFICGFLLDISQSSSVVLGHWTLLMILACYALAYLGFGNDNTRGIGITNILLISATSITILFAFIITNFVLGASIGNFSRIILIILSNGVWALLVTPFILPVAVRLHRVVFGNQAQA